MGLIGGIARTAVAAGTWTAVSNAISRRQAGRWAAEDQGAERSAQRQAYRPPPPGRYQRPMFQPRGQQPYQQMANYPQQQQQPVPAQLVSAQAVPPVNGPVNEMSARLAQLQQLGSLKAQGILSDAEFEAQKHKILGSRSCTANQLRGRLLLQGGS